MLNATIWNLRLKINKTPLLRGGLFLVAAGVLLHGAPNGNSQQKKSVWSDMEKLICRRCEGCAVCPMTCECRPTSAWRCKFALCRWYQISCASRMPSPTCPLKETSATTLCRMSLRLWPTRCASSRLPKKKVSRPGSTSSLRHWCVTNIFARLQTHRNLPPPAS